MSGGRGKSGQHTSQGRRVPDRIRTPGDPAEPVDLGRLDPAIWYVLSGDQTYGPYTIGQLQQFVIEGRLNAASRIAEGTDRSFLPIKDIPSLAGPLAPAFAERARRRAEAAKFLIIARAPLPAEAALWRDMPGCLDRLGKYVPALPGTWLLRSARPLREIRQALIEALPATVQIMIMETREARLGWIGFEEDMGEVLRPVWNAPLS